MTKHAGLMRVTWRLELSVMAVGLPIMGMALFIQFSDLKSPNLWWAALYGCAGVLSAIFLALHYQLLRCPDCHRSILFKCWLRSSTSCPMCGADWTQEAEQ